MDNPKPNIKHPPGTGMALMGAATGCLGWWHPWSRPTGPTSLSTSLHTWEVHHMTTIRLEIVAVWRSFHLSRRCPVWRGPESLDFGMVKWWHSHIYNIYPSLLDIELSIPWNSTGLAASCSPSQVTSMFTQHKQPAICWTFRLNRFLKQILTIMSSHIISYQMENPSPDN